ncbi:MAG TPA: peptidoglycan-binding protein [Clostridiaceae bacterium]|nr:peptidoglycan-binding protein [Clostridiaceae bacterium]
MRKGKKAFTTVIAVGMSAIIFLNTNTVSASVVLKKGMEGSAVTSLQSNLKKLGFFNSNPTGYYGDITETAVRNLQREYGYWIDGIAGPETLNLVDKLIRDLDNTSSRASAEMANPYTTTLKKGMRGDLVTTLQNDLKSLGFFNNEVTGYFGDVTETAVKNLQKEYGYWIDGVVGSSTAGLINRLLGRETASNQDVASRSGDVRSESRQESYDLSWSKVNSQIFTIGKVATVYDIWSGKSFNVKRTYGYNHADCETLTAEDTRIMKEIYGGQWSWDRRPIILDVDGTKIAASMAGMPHAGNESAAANTYVKWRSGGYGAGTNLDTVKGNEMDGHFDIHFKGSKTHGTNSVNSAHQKAIQQANEWAKNNY